MATVTLARVDHGTAGMSVNVGETWIATWTLTTADATGDPAVFPVSNDVSVQAYGTWGSGTLNIKGTNETDVSPSNGVNLTDPTQTTIALTSNGVNQILEKTYQYWPVLTGSTGATITVKLLFIGTFSH
jgi:hypothetical protein